MKLLTKINTPIELKTCWASVYTPVRRWNTIRRIDRSYYDSLYKVSEIISKNNKVVNRSKNKKQFNFLHINQLLNNRSVIVGWNFYQGACHYITAVQLIAFCYILMKTLVTVGIIIFIHVSNTCESVSRRLSSACLGKSCPSALRILLRHIHIRTCYVYQYITTLFYFNFFMLYLINCNWFDFKFNIKMWKCKWI